MAETRTIVGTVRRVWPGSRTTSVIVRVPERRLYYEEQDPFRKPYWVSSDREQVYQIWATGVCGQLLASLCRRAEETQQPVRLTTEPGTLTLGRVLTHVELLPPDAPQEASQ